MSNIRVIRVLSLAIMVAAATVSYHTQQALFALWKADALTSAVAPIAVDLLAVLCTLAIHTDGVARKGRTTAIFVLIVTGTASMGANFVAGLTLGSKIVHAGMVALYLLSEFVASTVKSAAPVADPIRSMAAKKAAATRKANAAKRARKPRAPKAATTVAPTSPGYGPVSAPSVSELEDAIS